MLLLVISPQATVRDYLGNVCRHFGYPVEFANSSADAIDRLNDLPSYGMILLDGLDTEFAQTELAALRTHTPHGDIVILSTEGESAEWKQKGARGILQAPILPSRLKMEVMRCVSKAA